MFPTHVGIARPKRRVSAPAGHVPYACGDCAEAKSVPVGNLICSLRMWGLRGRGRPRAPGTGMFPTHVGIARTQRFFPLSLPYVPYACGDCA